MTNENRNYRLDEPAGLDRAYDDLVTEIRNGFAVRLPSEGDRIVMVASQEKATVIAEAEVLRLMRADYHNQAEPHRHRGRDATVAG